MRRGTPSDDEALDESSLDEYGVWVKAGPEEPIAGVDETVSDLIDTAGDVDDMPSAPGEKTSLPPISDLNLDSPSGAEEDQDANILKGQEVSQMSEQDKSKSTSQTDSFLDENEIKLDDDELTIDGGDSDLDDLSDMLLNIDDESGSEETIYLEDDDLSLDLEEGGEDLSLEQENADPQPGDDFSDDIVIPGLDEGELTIDVGEQDSLPEMSLDSSSANDLELDSGDLFPDPAAASDTPVASGAETADIEMHNLSETGLDEFIDEQMQNPLDDEFDLETTLNSDDAILEEESLGNLGLDLSEEGEDIILDEGLPDLADDPLDLGMEPVASVESGETPTETIEDELSLDTALDESEDISGQESDIPVVSGSNESEPDIEFDDVGAFQDDLSSEDTANEIAFDDTHEQTDQHKNAEPAADNGGASQILRSIEDELHAIRSELTDLRSELRKLRGRGDTAAPLEQQDDPLGEINEEPGQSDETEAAEQPAPGKGFFDDDEDETIALTGDELDNILNSADFTEEAGTSDSLDDDMEMPMPPSETAEPDQLDDLALDVGSGSEEGSMPELMSGPTAAYEDSNASADYPPIEEISLQEMGGDASVVETGDTAPEPAATGDDPFEGSEREIETMAQIDIEQELAGIEDLNDEEDDIELYTGSDLDSIELDLPEDYSAEPEAQEFGETLPDGEIEGLAVEEPVSDSKTSDASPEDSEAGEMSDEMSFNLKQEIKAVLAYMDKLLESLPEEKIEEFAKSEHFDVYKKLFEELGL